MTLACETAVLEYDIPSPDEVQRDIPLTSDHAFFLHRSREAVVAILQGKDSRKLLIMGPCSIHDPVAACEYAERLGELQTQVSDQFLIIMRAYLEKPRTISGWKGLLYDPELDGSYAMHQGIMKSRQLLADLAERNVPVGCEFLEINTAPYYSDLVTWGCVGARTCASPPHRQLAASLNIPIGFKNSIEGSIDPAVHAIVAAAKPQVFLGISSSGQMSRLQAHGNPLCHIVLRGSTHGPNYHPEAVAQALQKCRQFHVREKLVIDCSHGNCSKKALGQIPVFESAIQQIKNGTQQIIGMMLESHLSSGNQPISSHLHYGVSITDPCLDWESSEQLILRGADSLRSPI